MGDDKTQTQPLAGAPAGPGKIEDITVHTMPQRFQAAEPETRKAKSTGLIILVGGVLILIAGLVFAYFYFIIPGDEIEPADSQANIIKKTSESELPGPGTDQALKKEPVYGSSTTWVDPSRNSYL